jgi:hypothetical protein
MYSRGFYCIGTAWVHRRGFPMSLNYKNNQPCGTLHVRVHRDQNMAAVHWTDCKGVHLLSTSVDPVSVGMVVDRHVGQIVIQVPTSPMQILYTVKMRGVDVNDKLRTHYTCTIATKKWWQRLLFFCVDMVLTNAFIVHHDICVWKEQKAKSHVNFLRTVALSLIGVATKPSGPQRRSRLP